MGTFIPNTESQRKEMLNEIGVENIEDLFKDIPNKCLYNQAFNIPEGISELAVTEKLQHISTKNRVFDKVLLGAGAYKHYIPSTVSSIASKEEFLTSYTPCYL